MVETNSNVQAHRQVSSLDELQLGDHLCSLYETEEEHRLLLTSFLRQGLERNQRVVYLVDTHSAEQILENLRDDEFDVDHYIKAGQLIVLSADESFMRDNVFVPDEMIAWLRSAMSHALKDGYEGLRVTGEMSWALTGLSGTERLIEYEAKLNTFLPGNKVLSICQYDQRLFPPDMLMKVLETHPVAVLGTEFYDNFYYLPAKMYLSDQRAINQLHQRIEIMRRMKETFQSQRESELLFRTLADSAPVGIFLADREGANIYVNDRCCMLTGLTSEQLAGKEWTKAIHPEDREKVQAAWRGLGESGDEFTLEYRFKTPDGRLTWVSGRVAALVNQKCETSGYVGTVEDITERKRLAGQVRHSEKMRAIGQLAGGIAHDFNNQLAGIMANAECMANRVQDDSLHRYADNVLRGCSRAADLVEKILAFSRTDEHQSKPVNIHKVLAEVVSLLEHSLDKRISIKQHLNAKPPMTMGDLTQLQNAILNVALNARDAMPEGGELIFRTDAVTLDEYSRLCDACGVAPGQYLQIGVTDTGCGMNEETKKRIFEPFFSTKSDGNGTGLGMGLAVVYGTVASHCGTVAVDSEVGRGTTFKFYLPLVGQPVSEHGAATETKTVKGKARVLIADDESIVREATADMLCQLGHKVTSCKDGAEAVEYYKESWREIDIVLLDVVMPKMGGLVTFLTMKKINPNIRALLFTGNIINDEAQSILDKGALGFLKKPFLQSELSQVVAQALKGGQS